MSGPNSKTTASSSDTWCSAMADQLQNRFNQSFQSNGTGSSSATTAPAMVNHVINHNYATPPSSLHIRVLRKHGREDLIVDMILKRELQERGLDDITSLTRRRDWAEYQLATFRHGMGDVEMDVPAWRTFRRLKREVSTVKDLQAKVEELRQIVEVWVANGVNP